MNRCFPRLIDNVLLSWKDEAKHKPLLLRGALAVEWKAFITSWKKNICHLPYVLR